MTVAVEDFNHAPVGVFPVSSTGAFDMFHLRQGNYVMTVKNENGDSVHSERVAINDRSDRLTIQMPEIRPARVPPSGVIVSLPQLTHRVPRKARGAYEKAEALLTSGDLEGSRQLLAKALELDPEFLEAWNNLGSRQMQLGQFEAALAAFQRAAELDASASLVQTNLGFALLALRRYSEAQDVGRRALKLAGDNSKPRYVLGLALYGQNKFTAETARLLDSAKGDFPNAGLALAGIHTHFGRLSEARQLLSDYLRTGRPEKRKEVEAMLAKLK